jgi:hypothetical protein
MKPIKTRLVWSITVWAAEGWAKSISMINASAPAAFTAAAICSKLALLRATRTNAEKSRAKRIAVDRSPG